jgi:hypothetical protein
MPEETIAEHFEDEGVILPLNMMLTNAKGDAVRLSIHNQGEQMVYY